MIWLVIIGCIVVALGAIFALGVYTAKQQRLKAPEHLSEATRLYEAGEHNRALAALDGAFWIPLDYVYEPEDAETAYDAIGLLREIFETMNTDASEMLDPLVDQLDQARTDGGEVDPSLADPVAKFLRKAHDDLSLANELVEAFARGEMDVVETGAGGGPDWDIDGSQAQMINHVGQLLLKGRPEEAVAFIDERLEDADGDLRPALLNQRGGAHFMAENYQEALTDYEACLELEPQTAEHASNAAEAAEKLGNAEAAKAYARRALDIGGDRHSAKTAQEILERL